VAHRHQRITVGWLLVGGCGWVPPLDAGPAFSGVAHNRTACAAWVARVNALDDCVEVTYDEDNVCSTADEQPPEMAAYYRCLTETAHCEGSAPKIAPASCVAPLVALQQPASVAGPVPAR
jgi:hypothetical protein